MMRRADWPERLAAWVEAHRTRPFAWGEWDCVLAAADCALALTGEDALAGLRWSGLKGALRQLEVEGGLEAACTRVLGPGIAPAFAQRGDVLLMPQRLDDQPAEFPAVLNVCLGEFAVGPGQGGLVFRPATEALAAWPVGR